MTTDSTDLIIQGPAGQLEAQLCEVPAPRGIAVICHPHPQHGGTMRNKVVTTTAKAFQHCHMHTLTFNYRGVGNSEGTFGHGTGEIEDCNAIITWMQRQYPTLPLWLAGFSFGSFIAASNAEKHTPQGLITIAPAVNRTDYSTLTHITCPWLLVAAEHDELVPLEAIEHFAKQPPSPLTLTTAAQSSHFFHGKLIHLRTQLIEWITRH